MSDLRWCLGVARWCRLPRTPSRRNSENMAPRRSYWSGTPLVLDRGHTNFRELRFGEVRRTLLAKRFRSQGRERVGTKIRCERKVESKHNELSRTQPRLAAEENQHDTRRRERRDKQAR